MTSSIRSIHTYINCGDYKRYTAELNDRSSIDQIHEQVRCLCGSYLPNSFCLMFYNAKTKKFTKLNQNQLEDGCNPFRLPSSIDDQDIESMVHFVELYIIDTTDDNDIQSGISCNETNPVGSVNIIKETESQQDIPINNTATNNNDYHSEDLFNALLIKERIDIDPIMQSLFISDNEELLAAHPIENQSDSNNTLTNGNDPDFGDLFNALLIEGQAVLNPVVNNNSSAQIATGDTMPPQNNSPILIRCQSSIELSEIQNTESNRLYFSLDVKPEQKNIYKSDQFNQKEEAKNNGYVTRIQGIKDPAQKMSSIWPKVRIPKSFRNKRNVRLVVFAVSEKIQNGMRIWFKHRDKGFLPKGFTRDSISINPIEFDVNKNNLTIEGDLKLDLQMTTLWEKLKESELMYQLDEQSTIELHPSIHDPLSPRLLCILKDEHSYYLNTICLSDFIRSKNPPKRNLTILTSTAQTNSTIHKRARVT